VKKTYSIVAAVLVGATLGGCASDSSKSAGPTIEEAIIASEAISLTAKVEAVDQAKRLVTLRGPDGKVVRARVDPAVRNFAQVRAGDIVDVRFFESIALEIIRGGGPAGASAELAAARAKAGQKPAGVAAERVRLVAKVQSIDAGKNKIQVVEPDGQVRTLPVQNPGILRDLKVGDDVVVVLTEVLAVAVEPSKAKARPQPKKPVVEEAVIAAETLTLTAKVDSVDHAKRVVTLREPDGRVVRAKVDPAVRNFDQVKAGDTVVMRYRESVALEIVRGGGPAGATVEAVGARAAPGQKPAGVVAERVRLVAKVRAIDAAKRRVTLEEPTGRIHVLPVQNAASLQGLKVGDDVEVVITEVLAMAVEPASKKR
jgi:Cu/Ag efflux protein CusF